MEIIQHKTIKIVAVAILVVMLMSMTMPVFAASTKTTNNAKNFFITIWEALSTVFQAILEGITSAFSNVPKTNVKAPNSVSSGKTGASNSIDVYLTNYKPSDDNNGNFSTAYAGVLLKEDKNGKINIVHKNVGTNSKGWYVYKSGGKDYVILARLKNNAGSYCGFEKNEIVEFKYNDVTYNGVILDCGGARRDLATLDIFRTENCTNYPGLVKSTATGTNKYLSVTTNF